MHTINRAILIVKPRTPYLDWVNGLNQSEKPVTYDELITEQSVFLIPEVDEGELELHVRRHFKTIFENELEGWSLDHGDWPQKRTFKLFKEWFQLEWGSEVYDLGRGEIERESKE
ncbi:MAG: hypothetical protein HQL72_03645 [Magnetococcales bacterium]|nr:hypothetical protein [Magnetococcales bacterium]